MRHSFVYSLSPTLSFFPSSLGSRTTMPCHPIHIITKRKRHCALQMTFRRESASNAVHPHVTRAAKPLSLCSTGKQHTKTLLYSLRLLSREQSLRCPRS